jgi:hypothetical protein
LGELLDADKSPEGIDVALFEHHYPDTTHLIFSGDTGNGYRAYAMLEELSKVMRKYGYTVELSPLAPGHAYNRTDARIAHMNTFLNLFKAKSRVFRAIGVAGAFHGAAQYSERKNRRYMARSHIFYRVVSVDRAKALAESEMYGAKLLSPDLHKGRMGVRGLLHFDFSVKNMEGVTVYIPGYARVREYADPAKPGNRSRVYTWRKDYAALMCQTCSDVQGGPVALLVSHCTKKKCSVDLQRKKDLADQAAARVQQSLPLHGDLVEVEKEVEDESTDDDEADQKSKAQAVQHYAQQEHTQDTREVRAVHGRVLGGIKELWFYVPEHTRDISDKKRKGWWLYPQPNHPGLYYIGPLDHVQNTSQDLITDETVFKRFPFDCTVQLNQTTGKPRPTTMVCVTSRPLTEEELTQARAGKDINEPVVENGEAQEDEPPPRPKPRAASKPKKKKAPVVAPSRWSSRGH